MPTIRRPRLLKADVLRDMKPASLAAFLSPYSAYFAGRGIALGRLGGPGFDFPALAAALASPTDRTPAALVEQLELLDLISDSRSALNFESEYHDVVQSLREDDDGAPDIALKIMLRAPDIALREFNRQALNVQRSLVSFRARPGMPFLGAGPERVERFKAMVVPWFQANARSGACHVHHLQEPEGDAFVIRHGDPLKRIGTLDEEGMSVSRILRPERMDVAHFSRATAEWQVSGLGFGLQELYRESFGAVFHGSDQALAYSMRYSLEPLREGRSSIRCDISSTVQFAELMSLRLELPAGQVVSVHRPPVFEALEQHGPGILAVAGLLEATFSFKIANRRTRPRVRVCPARDTVVGNNAHPAIDAWLVEHGFANDTTRLLASA